MKKEFKEETNVKVIENPKHKMSVLTSVLVLACILLGLRICTLGSDASDNEASIEVLPDVTTSISSITTTVATSTTTTVATTTTPIVTTECTTSEVTTTVTTAVEEEQNVQPEEEPVVVEVVYEQPVEQPVVEEQVNVEPVYEEPTPTEEEPVEEVPNINNMTLLGELKITGYVATGNPTASGCYPYVGGVAMSRGYGLPYGTQIYIEGLGYYTLNDTGCGYGVVDVFCSSISECYDLTSWRNVYVVN